MGLLIPGADMPKTCGLCPCINDDLKFCQATRLERRVEGRHMPRPKWCPLRYVPEEDE